MMNLGEMSQPTRISVARASVECITRADGAILMESTQKLGPFSRCIGDWLEHWAQTTPDRPFLCERGADGQWKCVTYGEARRTVWALAEALLMRDLGPTRPVASLSDNSIAMGMMTLGAMHAGIPFAPVSPAYASRSSDGAKLRQVLALLQPGLVFAGNVPVVSAALAKAGASDLELVSASGPVPTATSFESLCATIPSARAAKAFADVRPETVAKILFTSGSTGMPKGVINTHRMMCSNMQANSQLMLFHTESPPTVMDWLPWNHTAGGNGSFNKMLRYGGTLYIDEGKPTPEHFGKTIFNLSSVRITSFTNVPKGYELLLSEFDRNPEFREHFFADLEYMGFAGAAMPRHHFDRLRSMAQEIRGDRILFSAGYGATETAPSVTQVHFPNDEPANIGLPIPGTQLKLLPNGDKLEIRVRGPNVTPGYWNQEEVTRQAFDEEGFYRLGDAVRFVDANHPEKGLLFDGRVAEDFKLSSATWVNVASIRARAMAAGAPLFQDVAVVGENRSCVGLLLALNEAAAREYLGAPADVSLPELAASPEIRRFVQAALGRLCAEGSGSSNRPTRALVLAEQLSPDKGELTEKKSISLRTILTTRSREIEGLFADPPDTTAILHDR